MALDQRALDMFRAFMRTGSVTQAAKLLRTSQPTVSRELGALARSLELPLFERRSGRLFPTPEALALYEEVKRVYVGLERIEAAARSLRHSGVRPLVVACLPALSHTLVPRAVALLRAQHPDAAVVITSLESPALETTLSEQQADVGLVERGEAPPGCELTPLFSADEVCVLPQSHALTKRRVLTPRSFAGESFISFPESDPYRAQIDAVFAAHGVSRVLGIETTSAASVCALVQRGLGLSLVNPLTAVELAGPALHVRPFSVSIPFRVALVRPNQRASHRLRDTFNAALVRASRDLMLELRKVSGKRPPCD